MRIALVTLSLVLFAGCGDAGGPSSEPSDVTTPGTATGTPGSEFSSPGMDKNADALPECSEVWVVGKTLPKDYAGCKLPEGGIDRGADYACTDGKGDLIGHNEQFFARPGGQIKANGEDDVAFSHELFEVCKAK